MLQLQVKFLLNFVLQRNKILVLFSWDFRAGNSKIQRSSIPSCSVTLSVQCNFVIWNDGVTWNDTFRDSKNMGDSQTLTFEQNFADCSHIKPFFGEKFRQRLLAFVVGVVENFRDVIVYLESISKYEFETNMLFRWRKFSCLSPTIRSENSRRRSFKHLN